MRDSTLAGLPTPWPDSPWNLIRKAREGPAAEKKEVVDRLVTLYYKPVYRFFQKVLDIHGERLKDVTQDFFTRFVEKDFLKNIRHETSFRNFLRVACRRHFINWIDAERVRKMGRLEHDLAEKRATEVLDEELRSEILKDATLRLRKRLEADGKRAYIEVFEARTFYEGSKPPEYAEIAKKTGLSVFDVRNYLTAARKIFREILLDLASKVADDPKTELRELGLGKYF